MGGCLSVRGCLESVFLLQAWYRGGVNRTVVAVAVVQFGRSALHCAVTSNSIDVVKVLLQHGANPNIRNSVRSRVLWL